jgi:hypothetical protein
MDFPKSSELFRTFRDTVVTRSKRVSMNAVDRDGSDVNLVGAGGAAMGEEVVAVLADVNDALWLDTARGAKLDKLILDRYSELRKPASVAYVYVHFSCPTANPLAFDIPVNTKLSTSGGLAFLVAVKTLFPAGTTGPIPVLCRSALAGPDQNVDEDTIRSVLSQIPNAVSGLTITNPAAAAGGAPRETDAQFRDRARRFWAGARRGTKSAIELGGLAVPGVVSASATEGLTGPAFPNRTVSLTVSDAFTDALVKQGVTVPSYATKSQAFAAQVSTGLDEYRAYGIPVFVRVAQVAPLPIVLRLRYQAAAALDIDQINLLARTAVVNSVNALEPGELFDPTDVILKLKSIPGLDIMGDEVVSPSGQVIPSSPYQVLRSSLALSTVDSQATLAAAAPQFLSSFTSSSSLPV